MMLNVSSIEDTMARLEQALLESISGYQHITEVETVPVTEVAGRILAENILAKSDVPGFDRSTVDGYAVRAANTFGAGQTLPSALQYDGEIQMGESGGDTLALGFCRKISTGGALPQGADAVVMIEDTEPAEADDSVRYILKPVSPGQNIIFQGDDITTGSVLLNHRTTLKPHHIGALAAIGKTSVNVYRKLRIALISTGDELKQPGECLRAGEIYDVNTAMLTAMLAKANTEVSFAGIVPDEFDKLFDVLKQAVENHDLVIISGGTSAGERDHAAEAIRLLGEPGIIQHGLAVKPGKPTLVGLASGIPVIGLPGHPVAAWFMADQIVLPLIDILSGRRPAVKRNVEAVLSRSLPANHGRQSFTAVKLDRERNSDDTLYAQAAASKSGLITTLRSTDGYIVIDRDCEGLAAGSKVNVILWEDQ